jgi:hypothetical protein
VARYHPRTTVIKAKQPRTALEATVSDTSPPVLLPRYHLDGFDVVIVDYETGHDSEECFGCLAGTCVQRVERCSSWKTDVVTHAVWKELS